MPSVPPTSLTSSARAKYTSPLAISSRPCRAWGLNLNLMNVSRAGSSSSVSPSSFWCLFAHRRKVSQCLGLNWSITRELLLNGVSRFLLSNRFRDSVVKTFRGIAVKQPGDVIRTCYAGILLFWVYRPKRMGVKGFTLLSYKFFLRQKIKR